LACTERTFWVSKTIKERSKSCALPYDIILWHQACIILSGLQGFYNQAYNSLHLAKTCCFVPNLWLEQRERSRWTVFMLSLQASSGANFFQFEMSSNSSFLAWSPRHTSPINRGRLWRLKSRVLIYKSFDISFSQS